MRAGVTFEWFNFHIIANLARIKRPMLVRVVIQPDSPPHLYMQWIQAVKALGHTVQICPFDSSRIASLSEHECLELFQRCRDTFAHLLGSDDIYELGNEVGGGSDDPEHMAKTLTLLNFFVHTGLTSRWKLMVNGYAVDGWEDVLSAIPAELRAKLDYLTLSDYPLDGMLMPKEIRWNKLAALAPNAIVGIGETGIPADGDKVPHDTPTFPERLVVADMADFGRLRSPYLPAFQIPIHWWYGSQQFGGKKPSRLFMHFRALVEGLPT